MAGLDFVLTYCSFGTIMSCWHGKSAEPISMGGYVLSPGSALSAFYLYLYLLLLVVFTMVCCLWSLFTAFLPSLCLDFRLWDFLVWAFLWALPFLLFHFGILFCFGFGFSRVPASLLGRFFPFGFLSSFLSWPLIGHSFGILLLTNWFHRSSHINLH